MPVAGVQKVLFGEDMREAFPGESVCLELWPANFGSGGCSSSDTFCVEFYDTEGWTVLGSPPIGQPQMQPYGSFYLRFLCVDVPGSAAIDETDTLVAVMSYIDIYGSPLADTTRVSYEISSNGHIGPPIYQYGEVVAEGGECIDAHFIIDAGTAAVSLRRRRTGC